MELQFNNSIRFGTQLRVRNNIFECFCVCFKGFGVDEWVMCAQSLTASSIVLEYSHLQSQMVGGGG
jgi:hypothetical protein